MIFPLTFINGFLLIVAVEGIQMEGEINAKSDLPDLYDDMQDVHLIPTSSFLRVPKLPSSFVYGGNSPDEKSRIEHGFTSNLDSSNNMMPNYMHFLNELSYPFPNLNYDESAENLHKDETNYLHGALFKQAYSKRRLPLPLGPLMGFPLKSRPGTVSRGLAFAGIGKGVQRRSNRRPTACSFGTFGLVCWNASLRKNRVQGGGNYEGTF